MYLSSSPPRNDSVHLRTAESDVATVPTASPGVSAHYQKQSQRQSSSTGGDGDHKLSEVSVNSTGNEGRQTRSSRDDQTSVTTTGQ